MPCATGLSRSPVNIFPRSYSDIWGFPGGSEVKNLPLMQETQVQSLGREAPLEEEMAPHSSILAWRTPWTEEPGRLWGQDVIPPQQPHKAGGVHRCPARNNHIGATIRT